MHKIFRVLTLVGSLLAVPAFAADNALIVTPGVGVTVRSVDIGAGVQAPGHAFVNATGTQIGVAGSEVFVGGRGSAGTATGGVLTVQGVASMTPFLTNPGTAANWGIGATGAAVPANASYMGIISGGNLTGWTGAVTQGGTWTMQPGNTANTTPWLSTIAQGGNSAIVKAGNTFAASDVALGVAVTNTNANGQTTMANSSPVVLPNNMAAIALWGQGATGAAAPANAVYNGVLDAAGGANMLGLAGDPCQTSVKSTLPITLATAAVKVIAVGVSAKKIYVCQIHLTNNAADSVAVFEATTATTCATSPIAVVGAGTSVATAATGYNFAANGGISIGTGSNQVLQTATNANDLCIAQSAATQLTGSITYVTR